MICHFLQYWPIALCTALFTAYVVIRTVPQSINGQTRGKKKVSEVYWIYCSVRARTNLLQVICKRGIYSRGPFLAAMFLLVFWILFWGP